MQRNILTSEGIAGGYYVADESCQSGTGLSDVGEMSIHLWDGSKTRSVPFAFDGASAEPSLANDLISRTDFGFHQVKQCRHENGRLECQAGNQVVSPRKPLKLCRPDASFGRESVEGVALTSLAGLTLAYDFYRTLGERTRTLSKASLLVLPTVERVVTRVDEDGKESKSSLITTDNLAYAPYFNGQPAFVIFPKGNSAKRSGLWRDVNLWEIPWSLAHEFGHHVLRTHAGVTGFERSVSPIHAPPREAGHEDGLTLTARTVGKEEIWGSVNEAFADLYAYYALGAEPGLLDGVDCFESGRDVARSQFANGRAKVLDSEVLEDFFSSTRLSSSRCGEPSFQDVHSVGAIIAHGIDVLLTEEIGTATGSAAGHAKARLLLAWAEELRKLAQDSGSRLGFEELLGSLLELLAKNGSDEGSLGLSSAQCRALNRYFPALTKSWQELDLGCG